MAEGQRPVPARRAIEAIVVVQFDLGPLSSAAARAETFVSPVTQTWPAAPVAAPK